MEYRRLGKTELQVSVLALGCWPFAGGRYWGDQDDADSIATVHAALDAGINFFDTAEGYENGQSERVLGRALVGRRSQALIATKVSPNHLRTAEVITACENSLTNLQTDYIDLYQIHWPNHEVPLAETVEALHKLKQQGKIRAIGVSNFAVQDLSELVSLSECETNQLPYGLLWRVIEREIEPLCHQHEIGLICYSPLAQGLLTGRYRSPDEVPDGLARTRWYNSQRAMAQHDEAGCESEVFAAIEEVRTIAEQVGAPMATVALAWVKAQRSVTSVLVGARKPEELSWNLPAADLHLTPTVQQQLAAATEAVKEKLGTNADMWMTPSRMR
ncbi:MAG TPA: aldo/keto reductase [Caldilineaceae bacterium]|nr:aldo/keto reductase [Caldilineaceae bacterium]